jgi:hypothetical protein
MPLSVHPATMSVNRIAQAAAVLAASCAALAASAQSTPPAADPW